MKGIDAYLTFDGNCRQAMEFYKKCFAAELEIMPVSEIPGGDFPKEAKDKIMHSRLSSKGSTLLLASDEMSGTPVRQGSNFSIAIQCESVAEIDQIFAALSENGKVTLPLQETFWAPRFGMLTDQFGINWMFNLDHSKK